VRVAMLCISGDPDNSGKAMICSKIAG
jgi:hypothetical protein